MRYVILGHLFLLSSFLFAQTNIDSLENLLDKKYGIEKAILQNELANIYWNISPDKGLKYAEEAYTIALVEKNDTVLAEALRNKGVMYWAKSEYSQSLENYQKALSIWEKTKNNRQIGNTLSGIGLVYDNLSDYDKALASYLKSLKIAEDNKLTTLQSTTLSNISVVYLALTNYEKALETIQKSINICLETNNTQNLSAHFNNLGLIYEEQKAFTKAIETYKKALQLNEKKNSLFGITISLYNIGNCEYNLTNYDESMICFQRSLEISEEIDDKFGILLAQKGIGKIHKEQKKYKTALDYFSRSLELANALKAKDEIVLIYKEYSELYKEMGTLDKSLEYLELYISLKDTIYSDKSLKQIAEMQTKYDTKKKVHENELLRKENQLQTNIKNSFIVFSALILIIVLILLNRFRIKKKVNIELTKKNEIISIQKDKLEEAIATKDKFFTIISHDLRSPFNNILGFSDLLHKEYHNFNDSEIIDFLKRIHESSQSAYNLLDNLLIWARTQVGELTLQKETVNLKELVENSIAPYQLNATNKKIDIEVNIPLDVTISIDINTSVTIIGNLVNNAIKFTPEDGQISINFDSNNDYIELHVIDTGVGMTQEILNKLFNPDEIISTIGTKDEKGTGLGLMLCHEFVKKNGGNISVKSEVGKGSEFIISLPNI